LKKRYNAAKDIHPRTAKLINEKNGLVKKILALFLRLI